MLFFPSVLVIFVADSKVFIAFVCTLFVLIQYCALYMRKNVVGTKRGYLERQRTRNKVISSSRVAQGNRGQDAIELDSVVSFPEEDFGIARSPEYAAN